jgi:hypothetical protein
MCSEVDEIRMTETYDPALHPVAEFMLTLGFGKRPEELSLESADLRYWAQRLFPAPVHKLAGILGVTLDKVELGGVEFAYATEDIKLGSGVLKEGTISGLNYEYVGYCGDQPFIRHRWIHFVERKGVPSGWLMAPEAAPGEATPYQVNIEVRGRPNVASQFIMTDVEDTVWLPTAAVAIRAIPAVCDAGPGFLTEDVFGAWTAPVPA